MAIIEVPSGGSIQAAVTAATPGDIILVDDGIFHESVIVDGGKDNIRIVSKHIHGAVLDGQTKLLNAFTLTGVTGVEINGFVIKNYAISGIITNGEGGFHRIVLNKVKNSQSNEGISIQTFGNLVWRNESERNKGYGIYVMRQSNWIVGNLVHHNSNVGVFNAGGSIAIINNKIFKNSSAGIFNPAGNSLLLGNEIINNAVGIDNSAFNSMILNNNIMDHAGYGIRVDGRNNFVAQNNIKENGNSGVLIVDSFNNIEENEIKRNENNGLELTTTTAKNFIFRNVFEDNIPHSILDNGIDNVKLQNTKK